jgi:quercetin dioxygenase-like cupin family protein
MNALLYGFDLQISGGTPTNTTAALNSFATGKLTVFGITVFPPGSAHDVHRHPNAEETEYIVEGHGIARVGDDDVLVGPGDIVFASIDEYHGFVNTSDSERAVMVWCYGGAASLQEAGYVREADDLAS